MILRDGKILSAGCILPLTQNTALNKSLGTRHRAAIGMSENSDAVVVVVSEETGNISVAVNGTLKRDFNAITLQTELNELLLTDTTPEKESLVQKALNFVKRIKKENN
jgi:diadenylate cyclase